MSWIQSAFGSKISPVILFVIVLLSVIFFISAVLHLLIRFLLKQRSSSQPINHPEMSTSGAFQRQLQQLFHLHDSGIDQAHIDALPMFLYKDVIMGLKEHFDCAVCLCEFTEQDRLRLLPLCSHAFHIDCIDKWLLANSTCPLCRGAILSHGFSFENPVFYFDDSKEVEVGSSRNEGLVLKSSEDDSSAVISEKRVFSVRLGKFKNKNCGHGNEDIEGGESGNSNLDARRCYSMGSFQYVVDDSELQVAFSQGDVKGRGGQNGNFTSHGDASDGKKISCRTKGESFSVSKIWLWSKKGKAPNFTTTHYSNSVSVSLPS